MENSSGLVGTEDRVMTVEEQEADVKKRCAELFWLGVRYYVAGRVMAEVDEQEFRRRLQVVFDRAWARGGGAELADRHGDPIISIAHYGDKCAKSVTCSLYHERCKKHLADSTAEAWPSRTAAGEKKE